MVLALEPEGNLVIVMAAEKMPALAGSDDTYRIFEVRKINDLTEGSAMSCFVASRKRCSHSEGIAIHWIGTSVEKPEKRHLPQRMLKLDGVHFHPIPMVLSTIVLLQPLEGFS